MAMAHKVAEFILLDYEINTEDMLNGLERNKENGNNKICVSFVCLLK